MAPKPHHSAPKTRTEAATKPTTTAAAKTGALDPSNAGAAPTSPIPLEPPRVAVVPPAGAFVPARPTPPPPTIPQAADAPGVADKLGDGLRVTFGPDRSDLNPANVAALPDAGRRRQGEPNRPGERRRLCRLAPLKTRPRPRRLALSRALAARAVSGE